MLADCVIPLVEKPTVKYLSLFEIIIIFVGEFL